MLSRRAVPVFCSTLLVGGRSAFSSEAVRGRAVPAWGYNPDCDAKAASSLPTSDCDVLVGCPKGEYAQPGLGFYYDNDDRLRENGTCPK